MFSGGWTVGDVEGDGGVGVFGYELDLLVVGGERGGFGFLGGDAVDDVGVGVFDVFAKDAVRFLAAFDHPGGITYVQCRGDIRKMISRLSSRVM